MAPSPCPRVNNLPHHMRKSLKRCLQFSNHELADSHYIAKLAYRCLFSIKGLPQTLRVELFIPKLSTIVMFIYMISCRILYIALCVGNLMLAVNIYTGYAAYGVRWKKALNGGWVLWGLWGVSSIATGHCCQQQASSDHLWATTASKLD